MFSEIMRYILDLGPTVMLPLVIIVFSKLLGMKLGDCFKSGLHIGIGFVGIGLVIGLMLDSIGPAAKAMAEHFQINLHVIDVGWPGSSPMTWASQIALVAIPVAIGVNLARRARCGIRRGDLFKISEERCKKVKTAVRQQVNKNTIQDRLSTKQPINTRSTKNSR